VLDHLVYATPDLAATTPDLAARGLALSEGGPHQGLGTRNLLASLGLGRYLEVIGPDPDQPRPEVARPFGIDMLTAPRLVTWAIRKAELDPADSVAMSRTRPDGVVLDWRLSFPESGDGIVPFMIDWGPTPHPSTGLADGARLIALTATHPEPAAVTRELEALGAQLDVLPGPVQLRAVIATPSGEVTLR
jgi:glyoxalase-like protein